MKKFLIFIGLFTYIGIVTGQKNDYIWMMGTQGKVEYWSMIDQWYGLNRLDFNGDTLAISRDSTYMNFEMTNSTFSDDSGHLLFYTNGISIANKYHEKIENSDTLNPSYYSFVEEPSVFNSGYRCLQCVLTLPSLSSDNIFYLFHSTIDSLFSTLDIKSSIKFLKLSTIDMNANAGHGKVLSKNERIWQGTNYMGNITACKHGNGRDWWILEGHRGDNCFSRSLLSPSGISPEQVQCIGSVQDIRDGYSNMFSPDGTKYIVSGAYFTGVYVYDFDRCSGLLSNERHIDFPYLADSGSILASAVSANSRYLYVTTIRRLYQLDLWASDIAASKILIAKSDTGIPSSILYPAFTNIYNPMLAPDGKIYINTDIASVQSTLHVVEHPDLGGMACGYRPYAIDLPSVFGDRAHFPNNPNYRLGRLMGSYCDTLTGIEPKPGANIISSIKIFPNPATNYIRIDYGTLEWNSSDEPLLSIYDMIGNRVYTQYLPAYSGIQDIDISQYSRGIYMIEIRKENRILGVGKFICQP